MTNEKKLDIPSAEQLRAEADRLKTRKRLFRTLRSTIASLIVAAAVVVLLSELLSPALKVTGNGMSPTLSGGQTVLCSKYSDIKRGDVIAFYYNKKILIKRVIAVEGDTVEVKPDGTVILNGKALEEPYISGKALGECDTEFPCKIDKDRFFVMGDNREISVDSRSSQVGYVPVENIIGKVYLKVLPLEQLGTVE